MRILISLSGLPGVGKTTLAKELAKRTRSVHLRVDSVEGALKRSVLKIHPAEDAGYRAIAAIAKDNLLLGLDVIADTVNPLEISRRLWADTAAAAGARLLNVEVICSDAAIHRKRVEARQSDIGGLVVPDWQAVCARPFEPWQGRRLVVDTSKLPIEDCAARVQDAMARFRSAGR